MILLKDDLDDYPDDFDLCDITHLVLLDELMDGDLIPCGTVILQYWPISGNA